MIALRSKSLYELGVHVVLDRDKHGIGEALADRCDSLGRRGMEVLPRGEDQAAVDEVFFGHHGARLRARFGHSDDLARLGVPLSIHCIRL